jgi:hypothetical protein
VSRLPDQLVQRLEAVRGACSTTSPGSEPPPYGNRVVRTTSSDIYVYSWEEIQWDLEAIDYIRSRGDRYPAAEGIEPEWTQEVMADVDLLALEPDPKSRMGASRFIGHSRSAERVIVVIAYRDLDGDLHGVNAWPATGADLRLYQQGDGDGQDD